MRRDPVRRPRPGRLRVGLAAFVLSTVAGARAVSEGTGPGAEAPWATGKPVPVAADGGRARFTLPTPRPGSRSLVIVSALARSGGPFPVRLAARGAGPDRVATPPTAREAPRRPPAAPPARPAPVASAVSTIPPRERTFHLMARDGDVASASNYEAVAGKLRAVGHRVQVYVDVIDDAAGAVGPEVLRDLVTTFDDRVFPLAAGLLGQARDVDGDGRFTVLMSSRLTRLAGGRHAVDGFVRGADLDPGLAAPFSNHCDMMYLSTALAAGPHLRTVLAHEYTHAVTFSARAADGAEEEGWLDEALAHLVEDLHGFSRSNIDYRVSAFLSQPERYRLVVGDYYAADLFRSHGNRGGTYLFLRWCADRFGPGLIPALVRSDRRGVANLEAATGSAFADLYRGWSLALFFSGFDPSRDRDRDRNPGPGYRSLDVRGPFDGWDLAGPRTVDVSPGGPASAWLSAGTASRFLVVGSSPTGAVEVEVSAPPEALLQVTAVPLPDDLARVELSASTAPSAGGGASLRVRLREANGTPVRLTALAWEPLVPGPDPRAPSFRRAGLDGLGIAAAFGTSSLPARGLLDSRPIPAPAADSGPLVLKAVGTDARGRRVAGWAEIGEGD